MTLLTDLSIEYLLVVVLVMLVAGFVHGALGLGFPMVATPLLALVLDVRTAILITLLPTAVVNIASILRGGEWRSSVSSYWSIALFSLFGSAYGAWVIASRDPSPFQLLLAALIFLYLASSRFNPRVFSFLSKNPVVVMPLVGLVGGFAAGTTNVMVPILIIYSLSLALPKNTMVQMFNMCFLAGKLAQMLVFGVTGTITAGYLLSTIPFAIVGYCALLAGVKIRDRLPTTTFTKIVRIILLFLGILLILQVSLG